MTKTRRGTWHVVACFVVVNTTLCFALPAASQERATVDRGGFTLLLNAGIGFQHDNYLGSTETGFAGLNLGIGGFLTRDVALVFRASATTVDYSGLGQTSGVGGPAVQVWLSDRLHLEGGGGIGFWSLRGFGGRSSDPAFGVILGAGYALISHGRQTLRIGVEYAPAFTQPGVVHNLGISVGWQLL